MTAHGKNVVVAGGRDYAMTEADYRFLESALALHRAQEIFTDETSGVAAQAEAWAGRRGIGVQRVVADWGRKAMRRSAGGTQCS